ncbi:hypothetical protein D0Z07_8867 [Hyphodiscus hymeniophilus]|uniref:Synaptobrevin n=1 Tax=Hyphodiscus hymeniophilus TaxID=353542 RepID=A0A9P6SLD3_9HELO|nr:hypothetical protein D0Z07_8867 [Hyphodiscus hymeniophilus]
MARLSSTVTESPDTTAINLKRMLSRLQNILTDSATESKLRSSSYEREKASANIDYARTLLLRLEQDALQIKVQSKKHETQTDLLRKREALDRLSERLHDLDQLHEEFDSEADSSEGEDLLGEDTPGDGDTSTDEQSQNDLTPPPTASSLAQSTQSLSSNEPPNYEPNREAQEEPAVSAVESSTLRARNPRAELFAPTTSSSSTTGISTATTEALLTHNRIEQESLTSSMLSMAQQLRASSNAFASSLEDEKSILDRAAEGLDKNELGMEAAQRRMGYLRSMTEGRGWWGRMLMYAYIAGLMVLACVIVFVLPRINNAFIAGLVLLAFAVAFMVAKTGVL